MKNALISAVVAALVMLGMHYFMFGGRAGGGRESVYDRVMRTGTIRCGYNAEPPFLIIAPNTGELSGAGVDIIEDMGKLLDLKIEWSERVGWDKMAEGLQSDRYDLICSGKWVLAPQSRGTQFTPALYFSTVHAYGRADDKRFYGDIDRINSPDYIVTSMDGEINSFIARDLFPKARQLKFASMTDNGRLFDAVIDGKADVTFAPAFVGSDYMARNPGHIRKISTQPVALFDTALMFKSGESAFAGMLDAAIRQMQASGTIKAILDRYDIDNDAAMRVSLPVAAPGQSLLYK